MIRAILNYILRASDYDQEKTRGDVLYKVYIDSTHRIKELEQERDYLDTKCAAFENDFVLLDVTEKLKKAEARIAELEEALTKIANCGLAKHLNFAKSDQIQELRNDNARLREQLRWHSANEIPPVDERYKDRKVSVFVLIKTWGTMIKLGYYDFEEGGWKYAKGEIVLITEMLRWMYIPEDNQGTICTPEGE